MSQKRTKGLRGRRRSDPDSSRRLDRSALGPLRMRRPLGSTTASQSAFPSWMTAGRCLRGDRATVSSAASPHALPMLSRAAHVGRSNSANPLAAVCQTGVNRPPRAVMHRSGATSIAPKRSRYWTESYWRALKTSRLHRGKRIRGDPIHRGHPGGDIPRSVQVGFGPPAVGHFISSFSAG